jgi:molybdopterin-containing oxidoreductase family membrane subunit
MSEHESLTKQLTAGVSDLLSSKNVLAPATFFGLIFIVSVGVGLHAMFVAGYHHAYGVTREIPWGLLISSYVFFAVTSTGLCLVSAIGHIFGVKDFMPIAKRAVFLSILTLCSGFLVIGLDIENPFRMAIYNVISPNLTSNIWWMGTLYGICLLFMVVEFIFLLLGNHKFAIGAGLIAVVGEIAANSCLGGVFGMVYAREYWHGPFMSIFFVTSAMMSGCAVIIIFTWWACKLNTAEMDSHMKRAMEVVTKLGALLVAVILFFTIWKVFSNVIGPPGKREVMMAVLSGPYSLNFWGFEIILALILPFIFYLVSRGRDLNLILVASVLMIIGVFVMRYDMVVIGQILPSFYELGVNEASALLPYTPTFHEIMVVVAGFSLTITGFLVGEKVFQGHKSEIH